MDAGNPFSKKYLYPVSQRFSLASRRSGWVGTAAVWLCIYGTKLFRWSVGGRPGDVVLPLPRELAYLGGNCLAWMALTMLLFWVIENRRTATRRLSFLWGIPIVAFLASCMVSLGAALRIAIGRQRVDDAFAAALQFDFLPQLLYVAVILAIGYGIRAAVAADEERLIAAQFEAALARAELTALSGKLRPDFITLALGRISEVMPADPRRAQTLLARLGELLHAVLRHRRNPSVLLDDEVRLVKHLLKFQRRSFPTTFFYQIAITPMARGRHMPAFLLHYIVQHAIIDGAARSGASQRLFLRLDADGDLLRVQLQVTGDGEPSEPAAAEMESLRSHLAHCCGERYRLERRAHTVGRGYTLDLLLPAEPV